MRTLTRVIAVVFVLTMQVSPLVAQTQPKQQEEFTPIDQLPPQDQLPAAPLLIGAYAFVLLMLFGYLVMVSRRLSAIKTEVDRLEADVKRTGKG
jgi:CcmD family protein